MEHITSKKQSDGTDRRDNKETRHGNRFQAWKLFQYIWFYSAQLNVSNAEIGQIYRESVLTKFHLIFVILVLQVGGLALG